MNNSAEPIMPSNHLAEFFIECQGRVEATLQNLFQTSSGNTALNKAMQYATLNGGKRIRPILAYGATLAIGSDLANADRAACAVELMHCYSLVHDDLPAMDDDDLRRGRPTVHKAFDEATAILVGDALQSLAFEVIADSEADPATSLKMVKVLATASGYEGMVAGQAFDFEAVGKPLGLEQLQAMHLLKTGALISASVELGALSAPQLQDKQLAALRRYAALIGLAYQVQDDILDVTSDTHMLGKPQGSDQQLNKPTYTSLLGIGAARKKANDLALQAIEELQSFDSAAEFLRELAQYIVQRSH